VHFAIRIDNNAVTAIDKIFVVKSALDISSIPSTTNGPSDHSTQILTIESVYSATKKSKFSTFHQLD
jgi:hypothetical protein